MVPGDLRRRKVLRVWLRGSLLIAGAIALNIGWILLNWRTGLLLLFGIISFGAALARPRGRTIAVKRWEQFTGQSATRAPALESNKDPDAGLKKIQRVIVDTAYGVHAGIEAKSGGSSPVHDCP